MVDEKLRDGGAICFSLSFLETLTEIEVKNGQCFCKKQIGNNFSWSMLLSTIEMSSKCSKLFGSWFHLNFEHFDLISLADKSIRRKNERFIGL